MYNGPFRPMSEPGGEVEFCDPAEPAYNPSGEGLQPRRGSRICDTCGALVHRGSFFNGEDMERDDESLPLNVLWQHVEVESVKQ